MHVVIYLPSAFYSTIASAIVEVLQVVNDIDGSGPFSFEFVSKHRRAVSKSRISFPAQKVPSRRMDVLILLAGVGPEISETIRLLEEESDNTRSLIRLAERQDAIIASTCGASYLIAATGLLDGKRATISWWLKKEASSRFPLVRWEPSRMIIRQGRIYTTGAAFAGLELINRLLVDLGFQKQERLARKLMVLPPPREFQSPYEEPATEDERPFLRKINRLATKNIQDLNFQYLAQCLGMSSRSLSRKFTEELQISPGKWIQEKRLEVAKALLETTKLTISEICYRVGYQDPPSFSRLFSSSSGMTPAEYRRQL